MPGVNHGDALPRLRQMSTIPVDVRAALQSMAAQTAHCAAAMADVESLVTFAGMAIDAIEDQVKAVAKRRKWDIE